MVTVRPGHLRAIRALHTAIWALFASCIVATPILAWKGNFGAALALIGIVAIEVLVIVVNRGTCPLTPAAARYTDDRRPNFDIYLPMWLARYNKEIFGSLYGGGVLYTAARWLGWIG